MTLLRVCGLASLGFLLACSAGSSGELTDAGDPDGPPGDQQDGGNGSGDVEDYASGTRIKARVVRTPDGAKALLGWRDVQLNVDCYFSAAADSTLRCIPSGPYVTPGLYADGSCAIPAAVATVGVHLSPKYAIESIAGAYPLKSRVYDLGPVIPFYYTRSGGNCLQLTPQPGLVYYARSVEVPASTFQSATESLE
jgi:hypothetical protein